MIYRCFPSHFQRCRLGILCVEETDLENMFYLILRISQSNTNGMIEYVCLQAIYKNYFDPFRGI